MCTHVRVEPKILYFGTPVVLIASMNEDGSTNIAPMSSAWALGQTVVLGLGAGGQTIENLRHLGECTLNFPSDELWPAVERLAPLTGRSPVPAYKRATFRSERDKFGAAGLTGTPSECVRPPRIAECALQFEATVEQIHPLASGEAAPLAYSVEVRVLRVHADERIVSDPDHIDPAAWRPLIYSFRHYFELGAELGKSFRSET